MTKFKLLLLSLLFCSYSFAQSFEVPEDYVLKEKDDYSRYHQEIIAAAGWLENTPLNEEPDKRKRVNAFLFQWVSGSPDVAVELQQYVSAISEKNPQMLLVFLGGWARYQLQHPAEKDKVMFHMAGLESVLRNYEMGGVRKDKKIEKLLKYRNKEKLDSWIKKRIG